MADEEKDTTAAPERKEGKSERHDHVWQSFVSGDGSTAVNEERCSICFQAKKGD
jgi:hypothetical protein